MNISPTYFILAALLTSGFLYSQENNSETKEDKKIIRYIPKKHHIETTQIANIKSTTEVTSKNETQTLEDANIIKLAVSDLHPKRTMLDFF